MMADKAQSPQRPGTIDSDSTESILAEFARLLCRVASEIPEESRPVLEPEDRLGGENLSERISVRTRRA